jgi:hypothetical protein
MEKDGRIPLTMSEARGICAAYLLEGIAITSMVLLPYDIHYQNRHEKP